MADSPSPYAPGIIGDERTPPRPAGRASVFLVATVVMALVTSQLWQEWSRRAMMITGHTAPVQLAIVIASIPSWLVLLWAYLSDAVPLWGTRREGYLMLSGLVVAVVWIALAAAGARPMAWYVAAAPLGLASAIARVAIAGGLTEIGRRRGVTGPLAAAQVALLQIAVLASAPLLRWSAWAAFDSIWLVAGVAAGLALALVMLTAALSDDAPPAPPPGPTVTVPRFLRSRALRSALPMLAFLSVAVVPTSLLVLELRESHGERIYGFLPEWEGQIIAVAAIAGYLLASRRVRFTRLLAFALLTKAITFAVLAFASHRGTEGMLRSALVMRAAADGLASAAILDLAMRLAPPGREAFGAILVAGFPGFLNVVVQTIAMALSVRVESLAWFAAAAVLAAAIAVSLLPKEISDPPDGRVLGSPP